MSKKKIIIPIAIILIICLSLGTYLFLNKNSTKNEIKKLSSLMDKPYEIINLNTIDGTTTLNIKADLDKHNSIILAKRINNELESKKVKISYYKDNPSDDSNGFYTEGMTNEVEINKDDRKLYFNEFKEDKLDDSFKNLSLKDIEYKNVTNTGDISEVSVSSKDLNENNINEELHLLSKIIKDENPKVKNVILTTNLENLTYGIASSNPNIVRISETIEY
ncbi:hypothetical protein [Clostridium chrysemydis]|uniref:hypothetical protein n=1 Tax=Clostridium chrysemydis TaxID=2665504 RepID=UPI0018844CE5|nr:hypothetical protein [Clostridium chrysemydis]